MVTTAEKIVDKEETIETIKNKINNLIFETQRITKEEIMVELKKLKSLFESFIVLEAEVENRLS